MHDKKPHKSSNNNNLWGDVRQRAVCIAQFDVVFHQMARPFKVDEFHVGPQLPTF